MGLFYSIKIKKKKRIKISNGTTVKWRRGSGGLDIELVGVELTQPDHNAYSWAIEPGSPKFQYLGRERFINLDTLQTGKYTFRFTACNSDNVWNQTPFSFQLMVLPNYTFRNLIILFLFVVLLSLYLRKRKNDSKNKTNDIKYAKNKLEAQKLSEIITGIEKIMEEQKSYKSEHLYINDIAAQLGIHSNYLSQAINQQLGINFSEYINIKRTEEAKRLLADPNYDYMSVFGIGLEAGFNSKATFYSVFKKLTRLTPAQFRKERNKRI